MTVDTAFVIALIGVAGLLMASNRMRYDLVALLVVPALMLSGVLTVDQALAGFGSPVFSLVAALLIVGAMLERTGAARAVGDWILQRGGSNETLLPVLLAVVLMLLEAPGLPATLRLAFNADAQTRRV